MKGNYGQQGWKEFHRNRKDILSEFDKILEQTENRPIRVAHGIGVEAYLRMWLEEFLPKKFGVTSGYIIPNLFDDSAKIYHFDIIIYDILESPILWVEGNFDSSDQGKYRAIPAKHVLGVYEVKSRFNKKNIVDSIGKLNQTVEFKDQLNPLYHCGIIFIDLMEKENNNESLIKELFKGSKVFGFRGGMVLRYEGDDTCTGKIDIYRRDPKDFASTLEKNLKLKPIAKPIDELNIYYNEENQLTVDEQMAGIQLVHTTLNNWSFSKTYGLSYEEDNISVYLSWSRNNFSGFCIHLLSSLAGLAVNDENRPSFGLIFDTAERKKTQLQETRKEKGKAFLNIKVYDGTDLDKQLEVSQHGLSGEVTFWLVTENCGDLDVTISDDYFKTKVTLPKGISAMKKITYKAELKNKNENLEKMIQKGLDIPYRIVYYTESTNGSNKIFFAIEKVAKYKDNRLNFTD